MGSTVVDVESERPRWFDDGRERLFQELIAREARVWLEWLDGLELVQPEIENAVVDAEFAQVPVASPLAAFRGWRGVFIDDLVIWPDGPRPPVLRGVTSEDMVAALAVAVARRGKWALWNEHPGRWTVVRLRKGDSGD